MGNLTRFAFYVEGEVERELIKIIRNSFQLHKIASIKNPIICKNKQNRKKIINEVIEKESSIKSNNKTFVILVFDKEAEGLQNDKIIDLFYISQPSIDYAIARAIGLKNVSQKDSADSIKSKIKKHLNYKKENYLSKQNIESRIDFEILISELGKLGEIINSLRLIANEHSKNYNINYSKINKEICSKIREDLIKNNS